MYIVHCIMYTTHLETCVICIQLVHQGLSKKERERERERERKREREGEMCRIICRGERVQWPMAYYRTWRGWW